MYSFRRLHHAMFIMHLHKNHISKKPSRKLVQPSIMSSFLFWNFKQNLSHLIWKICIHLKIKLRWDKAHLQLRILYLQNLNFWLVFKKSCFKILFLKSKLEVRKDSLSIKIAKIHPKITLSPVFIGMKIKNEKCPKRSESWIRYYC